MEPLVTGDLALPPAASVGAFRAANPRPQSRRDDSLHRRTCLEGRRVNGSRFEFLKPLIVNHLKTNWYGCR
jgi:hypothetical protein